MSSVSGQLALVAMGFIILVAIFVVFHKQRSGWSWGDFIVEVRALLRKAPGVFLFLLTGHISALFGGEETGKPASRSSRIRRRLTLNLFGGEGTGKPASAAIAKTTQREEGDGLGPPLTAAPSGGAGGDPRLPWAGAQNLHEIANSQLTLADIPPPGATQEVDPSAREASVVCGLRIPGKALEPQIIVGFGLNFAQGGHGNLSRNKNVLSWESGSPE